MQTLLDDTRVDTHTIFYPMMEMGLNNWDLLESPMSLTKYLQAEERQQYESTIHRSYG